MNRRQLVASAALATATLAMRPARAEDGRIISEPDLFSLPDGFTDTVAGAGDAPVTIIEYSSTTCGHCGDYFIARYGPNSCKPSSLPDTHHCHILETRNDSFRFKTARHTRHQDQRRKSEP